MPNSPKFIIVHCTAIETSKANPQFDIVDRSHKNNGWGGIGYHYLIEKDGTVRHGRPEREVGAHCKEQSMNFQSVGVCMAGHFDRENPSDAQKQSLLKLINDIQKRYGIPDSNVQPHRKYNTGKTCPGLRVPNDILGYLRGAVEENKPVILPYAKEAVEWTIKEGIATKWENPDEIVVSPTAETMLFRAGLLTENSGKGLTKQRMAVLTKRFKELASK